MKTVFWLNDILHGINVFNNQYFQMYIRQENNVCSFGKVNKLSFRFLQCFGHSGYEIVYRRDHLAKISILKGLVKTVTYMTPCKA